MKVNLNQKLRTTEGKLMQEPFKLEDGTQELRDVDLRNLFYLALRSDQEHSSAEDKMKEFGVIVALANNATEPDLSSDQVSLLKKKCFKLYDCFVAGQIELILEGKEIPF